MSISDYVAIIEKAQHERDVAKAEAERLRAALEEVVDPVGVLKKRAEAKGDRLSGMAYSICNEVGYLKNIAKAALSRI